jgi:hypothetical protein
MPSGPWLDDIMVTWTGGQKGEKREGKKRKKAKGQEAAAFCP